MKNLALFAACIIFATVAVAPQAGEKQKPLRVCYIAAAGEYEPDKTLPILEKYVEAKNKNVVSTRVFAKSKGDLPGLEALDKCDVVVLFTRRLDIKGEQLERIKKYCTSGKPLVGIRTASHAFQNWLDLDKEVFGGNYKNHYDAGPLCDVQLPKDERFRRVLNGVTPFKSKGSLYRNTGHAKDVDVCLYGSIPDHTEPIAWTRNYKGGRIFYTSLGHQKDFEEESFLRLMSNAIVWAGGSGLFDVDRPETRLSPAHAAPARLAHRLHWRRLHHARLPSRRISASQLQPGCHHVAQSRSCERCRRPAQHREGASQHRRVAHRSGDRNP